jgi:hypothetical protein
MHLSVKASLLAVSDTIIIAALNLEVIAARIPGLSIGCLAVSFNRPSPRCCVAASKRGSQCGGVRSSSSIIIVKRPTETGKTTTLLSTAPTAVSPTHHGANSQQSVESAAPPGIAGRYGFFDFISGPRPWFAWFADDSIHASHGRTFLWPTGHLGAYHVR